MERGRGGRAGVDGRGARSMAVAAVHGMDYRLSWNCSHIANATIRRAIEKQCRIVGANRPSFVRRKS